jgi:hypothetical protein
MRRISAYFISLLAICLTSQLLAQDSLKVPLNIRVGFDIFGPLNNISNKDNISFEGYVSYDQNSRRSYVIETGYQNYKYSQYNYNYLAKGAFLKIGADFNLIKPFQAEGKYWGGIGLRYGISYYSSGMPTYKHENYWGTATGTLPTSNHLAHFVEINPGIRTQLMKYVSIGWNIRLKFLISGGAGSEVKSLQIPGFGNGTKVFSPGINYYISISIPYKSVFVKPEVEKVTEPDNTGTGTGTGTNSGSIKKIN